MVIESLKKITKTIGLLDRNSKIPVSWFDDFHSPLFHNEGPQFHQCNPKFPQTYDGGLITKEYSIFDFDAIINDFVQKVYPVHKSRMTLDEYA